jgi:hypothetical protein
MRHYNWNGSSPAVIAEELCDVLAKLQDATDALARCYPHGRDYQGAEPGQYLDDRKQHETVMGWLADVQAHVYAHASHAMEATR